MLLIKNLTVQIANQIVIKDLTLAFSAGEIAVLMGPNGSGKSSLANTLMGHPDYEIVSGEIWFCERNITHLSPHERAKLGLFLAFQNPKAIPGLQVFSFLKTVYESYTGLNLAVLAFEELLALKLPLVGLSPAFMYRDVNSGFSGGETKRFEILQLLLLQPKLAIIDEIDSGLDIDALKLIADALCNAKLQNPELTIVLITHYRRILNFLQPQSVHIISGGQLIRSGEFDLVEMIEKVGYEKLV
jgi:Fe-S cluster assembly ATP-binding protein